MRPNSAKLAKYRVFCGYTWENPGIPGKYPATAWVSCRFPQFCLRFCPRPALRLRETREFPEWSTKHPLFSLEISGNAKCWGPSVFLFVCRKTSYRPTSARVSICPPLSICLTEPHHSTPLTLPLSLISHLCPRVNLPTSPPVPVPHLPSACVCDVLWRRLRLCDVLVQRQPPVF